MMSDSRAVEAAMHGHVRGDPLRRCYASDAPPKPTEWIVGGLVPAESCLVLGAEEKTGKTWLLLQLAICVVSGAPVLGKWLPRRRGTVLLYSPESGPNARRQRLWGLCWGMGADPAYVLPRIPIIDERINLGEPACIERLRATVSEEQPALVVFDPLITAHAADENASNEMQPILSAVRDLLPLAPGCSLIVSHHLNKAHGERSPWHGLRGSSALGAWSDGLIKLRRDGDGADAPRRIEVIHRDAPSPLALSYRLVVGMAGEGGCPSFRLVPEAPRMRGEEEEEEA